MRSVFEWNIGSRTLLLGKRTLIMGVLNVTPDSFSDGGLYVDRDKAVEYGLRMLADGAEIIDVGGESTRPGARVSPAAESATASTSKKTPVSEEEELERVVPVIKLLKQKRPDAILSIDTYKAVVAREAHAVGAEIVNDVSGFRWDPQMRKTLAELKCGVVLVHMRGRPEEWHKMPPPSDIVVQVKRELRDWVDAALTSGVKREHIALDPGFGFGKSFQENYPLLKRFEELHQLRYPLLRGCGSDRGCDRQLSSTFEAVPGPSNFHG
jgi:dihydropteroate synthase